MKSITEKFRPLTHYEIVTEKPFRVRIGDSKWWLESNLMQATSLVTFHAMSQAVLAEINKNAEDKSKSGDSFDERSAKIISGFVQMVALVYEVCKKPLMPWNRVRKRAFMIRYYLNHTEELFKVFETLWAYNTRIFFLLRCLAKWELFQTAEYRPIGSSKFASPNLRTLTAGLSLSKDMNSKNSRPLQSLN